MKVEMDLCRQFYAQKQFLNFQDSANNKNVMELELIKARLYIESPIIKGLLSSSVIYPKL